MMKDLPKNVVLFDGVCNLCNSSIDFIIRNDKKRIFKVAALQSQSGQALLKEAGWKDNEINALDSIVLYQDGNIFKKSTAALKIARKLPFPIYLAYGLMIVPLFIRNYFYDVIARNRYRWFGKKETCRLPTEEERSSFLE